MFTNEPNSQLPLPPYTLRVSRRARIVTLRIDHRGLIVVAPRQLNTAQIRQLFSQQHAWLAKHQDLILTRTGQAQEFKSGQTITLFGEQEHIAFVQSTSPRGKVRETATGLEVHAPEKHSEVLVKWLKRTAKQGILTRVAELAEQHNLPYQSVAVRDQHTRWGSCSSKRNLNFSWRLALAPLHILDYVILHELAHTKHMNHSKQFWSLVEELMPAYKDAENWLTKNGYRLKQDFGTSVSTLD